eukprot:TRINITY_DN2700_c0_g1_i1.p1 TRINITY_DN2700_c0_g1~~TRINITY_DN2700_c0_g1_i1.p1  ORF type:complete len:148 (+),score=11.37 TRINITY_DN2700_c0_g1_i1:63-506(+)
MASLAQLAPANVHLAPAAAAGPRTAPGERSQVIGLRRALPISGTKALGFQQRVRQIVGRGNLGVVCAAGDVSSDATGYLVAGAALVALVGTAFPILFSRKDLCPVCDGAGFVRFTDSKLNANAARKDLEQIVCKNCNGLGKIGQIDK